MWFQFGFLLKAISYPPACPQTPPLSQVFKLGTGMNIPNFETLEALMLYIVFVVSIKRTILYSISLTEAKREVIGARGRRAQQLQVQDGGAIISFLKKEYDQLVAAVESDRQTLENINSHLGVLVGMVQSQGNPQHKDEAWWVAYFAARMDDKGDPHEASNSPPSPTPNYSPCTVYPL